MRNSKYLQKMFFLLMMGCSLSFICVACSDDEDEAIKEPSNNTAGIAVTGAVEEYGCSYAHIIGYANLNLLLVGNGNPQIGIEIRSEDSEEGYFDSAVANSLNGNVFTVKFYGLSPTTKYKYRSFVEYKNITYYGDYQNFATKKTHSIRCR